MSRFENVDYTLEIKIKTRNEYLKKRIPDIESVIPFEFIPGLRSHCNVTPDLWTNKEEKSKNNISSEVNNDYLQILIEENKKLELYSNILDRMLNF